MKKFLWRQWYRFGLGGQFLALINLALLSVTAGKVFGINGFISFLVLVPLGLIGVWAWGLFLDLKGLAMQNQEEIGLKRMPFLTKHYALTEDIHKALYPDILVDEPLESD